MSTSVEGDAIAVMNVDGSGRRRLVEGLSPTWLPDGSRIAFAVRKPSKRPGIYVIDSDGRHIRRLTPGCESPAWSPNGSKIAYTCASAIWLMNADGTGRQEIAPRATGQSPAWSPDGTRIAFESGFPDARVYVMNADGSGMRRLAPHINYKNQDCNVAWSPDGKRLAFSPVFFGRSGIYLVNADGTHVAPLKGVPNYACGISWRRVRG